MRISDFGKKVSQGWVAALRTERFGEGRGIFSKTGSPETALISVEEMQALGGALVSGLGGS